jgi:adenosylmethionine-8-amino-7-oxononanoate aminotransferase
MMTPPLIATPADIDEIVSGVERTLRMFTAELHKSGLVA